MYPNKQLGPVDGDTNDASRVSLHTVDVMQAQHIGAGRCVSFPACAVWLIRDDFLHPYGQPARQTDGMCLIDAIN